MLLIKRFRFKLGCGAELFVNTRRKGCSIRVINYTVIIIRSYGVECKEILDGMSIFARLEKQFDHSLMSTLSGP